MESTRPRILACCLRDLLAKKYRSACDVGFSADGRDAFDQLASRDFALFLTSARLPDTPFPDFIRRLADQFPSQPWALVSDDITEAEEILARQCGALMVLDTVPPVNVLTDALARCGRKRFPVAARAFRGVREMELSGLGAIHLTAERR